MEESAPPPKASRYAAARRTIQDGDVLLFESRGWVSAVIRWASRSRYSHAALAAWWNSRLLVVESREGSGCRAVALSDVLAAAKSIRVLRVRRASQATGRLVVALAVTRLGRPYGWRSILKDALSRLPLLAVLWRKKHYSEADLDEPGSRVKCSTLVSWAWREAGGIDLVPNLADRSTDPGDLARCALLDLVVDLDPSRAVPS